MTTTGILMCDWKSKPDETGDWLWVCMWSCDCCVRCSGIVWITEEPDEHAVDLGNGFHLHWEGSEPEHGLDVEEITAFMKVALPDTYFGELKMT